MAEKQLVLIPLTDAEKQKMREDLATALSNFLKTEEDRKALTGGYKDKLKQLWKEIKTIESRLREDGAE
jgi:hypothetical protein